MPDSADLAHIAADGAGRLLQKFSLQVRKTLRSHHDPNVIHDFRVAIRRFSQALDIFKPWFVSSKLRPIRRQLKTLLSAAGDVRNSDIGLELLADSGAPNVAQWASRLHDRRKSDERRLIAGLRRWVAQKRGAKWRAELAAMEPPEELRGQSWADFARSELPGIAKEFFQAGNRGARSRSGKELHEVRIEAKHLRYSLELFQDALEAEGALRIEQVRRLQTVLGNINDARTTRKVLEEIGAGRKLTDPLRKRQRKKTREFHSHWETEFSRAEARQWMQFLRGVPKKPAARSTEATGDAAVGRKASA